MIPMRNFNGTFIHRRNAFHFGAESEQQNKAGHNKEKEKEEIR
jgi:hypothetical protein